MKRDIQVYMTISPEDLYWHLSPCAPKLQLHQFDHQAPTFLLVPPKHLNFPQSSFEQSKALIFFECFVQL
jgi:hypothetical protein